MAKRKKSTIGPAAREQARAVSDYLADHPNATDGIVAVATGADVELINQVRATASKVVKRRRTPDKSKKKPASQRVADALLAGEKVNKSQLIRSYLEENPDAGPKEASEALTKQTGIEISPAFVSQIKQLQKAKTGERNQPVRKTVASNEAVLDAAIAFIKAAGGRDKAAAIMRQLASL